MIFSKDTLDKVKKDEKAWQETMAEAGVDDISKKTASGIDLKPMYTPADLEGGNDDDVIVLPGEYPFTRGLYPLHYQVTPVMNSQQMSLGDGEQTKERREFLEKIGRRMHVGRETDNSMVMMMAIDEPTFAGFDADEPEARGKVGECAVSMCIMDELIKSYEGAPPLSNICTLFVAFNCNLVLSAMYAAYCMDVRKEPLEGLVLWANAQLHCQYYLDIATYPPAAATKLKVEQIKWLRENCPKSGTYIMDGYNVAEAGAIPSFEIACCLAEAIHTADACVEAGLDPDDFLPSFFTHLHLGINVFEEVAKFRAARRLWAKLVKERYGCKNPDAMKMRGFLDQGAGYDTVAQEPLNNVVRNTIMVMAGLFSDLDGIHPIAYDEPLGIPTNESLMLSTRTMQILVEETDITHVTDPMGGSYYVEWLTNRMEEEIQKHLKGIDDRGGFIKCYESGWLRAEVARQAYEKMKAITNGEAVRVGFNKYKVEEKTPPMKIIRRPMELEDGVIERVKRHKRERDNEKTGAALSRLEEVCQDMENNWPACSGNLMPTLIESVRAGATLGECCRVFREVFGYGYWAK